MQQLCTNIIFKLKIMIAPDNADKRIGSAGDQESIAADPWPFEKFEEWFRENSFGEILMTRCCSLQHNHIHSRPLHLIPIDAVFDTVGNSQGEARAKIAAQIAAMLEN